jgi:predicted amidohydrolase
VRVVVTQPGRRSEDGLSDIASTRRLLGRLAVGVRAGDLVLLPELIGGEADAHAYQAEVQALASDLGAWVVGGSHFAHDAGQRTNRGIVADPSGRAVASYGKLNPYGDERMRSGRSGPGPASFQIGEISCLVMICADFWHASAFAAASPLPDLILVPAFSLSQRPDPHMARARWRHAMVARAYEFAAFVAVSDWAHPVAYETATSSGVAGLAHPNPSSRADLHRTLGRRRAAAFDLDMEAVRELRSNREGRGFDLTVHLRR